MSYRVSYSDHYSDHPHYRPQDHARPHVRRPAPLATTSAGQVSNAYTLAHAGRQVRFRPAVFWIVIGTITIMGTWSAATATYFAFRDDVLTRLIARQTSMQYAYEDRIAELRVRLDRTASRQLLDQQQFDQKLDQIARRQAALESRTTTLSALPDISVTGSIKPTTRNGTPGGASSASPKPSPISDTVIFVTPPDREARLESRTPEIANTPPPARYAKLPGPDATLLRLQASLDQIEGRQIAALNSAEDQYESRIRRMRGVFADLGLDPNKMAGAIHLRPGIGGPFVPAKLKETDAFERQVHRIGVVRAQIDKLTRTLALVPYRKPVFGEVEFSSGFGVRSDPFFARPAMHTGLDFRASTGDPVRAAASGRVESAGWNGGYGRMVEIDHGNGLSTRYGHLSEVAVKVGDTVRTGHTIGAVGSTGRSTGPHLHYETRINGEAVDPQKFLRAGVRLGSS